MTDSNQTIPAPSGPLTEPAGYDYPTMPHLSQARADGVAWSERMFREARACAGDGARFLVGLVDV